MATGNIDTVLFDFDGTIMNTNDIIISSWQHAFLELTGQEGSLEEIKRSFGERLDDTVRRFFPDVNPEDVMEAYRSFHYDRFAESISLFAGIAELLERLKSEGYAMGLVTARMLKTTKVGMDKYGLDRYFNAVVSVEDTANPKPAPDPILLCLERLGKEPRQAIMVGDTKHDIQSARAAGVTASVLVGWSLAVPPGERGGSEGPDFVIDEADGLMDVLSGLNGQGAMEERNERA